MVQPCVPPKIAIQVLVTTSACSLGSERGEVTLDNQLQCLIIETRVAQCHSHFYFINFVDVNAFFFYFRSCQLFEEIIFDILEHEVFEEGFQDILRADINACICQVGVHNRGSCLSFLQLHSVFAKLDPKGF
jgi:hypothetical protein